MSASLVEMGWYSLGLLGGGSVVIADASTFVSQHFANRSLEKQKAEIAQQLERLRAEFSKELETHKHAIRRQELVFERDVAAAQAGVRLNEAIQPRFHPDMDWDEACCGLAWNFSTVEKALKEFRFYNAYLLSSDHRALLLSLEWKAAEGSCALPENEEATPSKEVRLVAGEIMEKVKSLTDELISKVR